MLQSNETTKRNNETGYLKMLEEIKKIINESACDEEIIVTVEEMFGDAGINILFELGFDF